MDELIDEQLATDLVNLIRSRMCSTAINVSVLDDVARALALARQGWVDARLRTQAAQADALRAT